MLPLAIETIVQSIKLSPFVWVRDTPTNDELEYLKQQAYDESPFDPLSLRKTTFEHHLENKARLICKRGPFARVLAIVYPETRIPWKVLGDIFSAFGPPPASCVKKGPRVWTVYLFANQTPRLFPPVGTSVGPENINGGYAFPNDAKSIVVYREEECERVLVHELLHACGSDNMNHSVEIREALTESFAEIFLIGILAKGSLRKASQLWKIQSQWISDQNARLKIEYSVNDISDYPWRYTLAREFALRNLSISLPHPTSVSSSLRFTSPLLLTL